MLSGFSGKLTKNGGFSVMYFFGLFWDPTLLLLLPALAFAVYAQIRVSSAFQTYSAVASARGIPAQEAASVILRRHGAADVSIQSGGSNFSDHYNPLKNTIRLSPVVYGSSSIAAVAIAAHESGHALQHSQGYLPLKLRSAILPVVNLASSLAFPLLLFGLLLGVPSLAYGAAIAFGAVFVFQLVTLPVEFNASRRAIQALEEEGILLPPELAQAKKVLSAAALTYVATTLTAFLHVLRLFLLAHRRNN